MQLTKNFDSTEFACPDGTAIPPELMPNLQLLAENLQVLRDAIKEPIHINSGYRSPYYNDVVLPSRGYNTAKSSQHKKGKAADIVAKNTSPTRMAQIIEALIEKKKMKQGGIGIYAGFVHYDVRGRKARW